VGEGQVRLNPEILGLGHGFTGALRPLTLTLFPGASGRDDTGRGQSLGRRQDSWLVRFHASHLSQVDDREVCRVGVER
jgi:hypothetical protein